MFPLIAVISGFLTLVFSGFYFYWAGFDYWLSYVWPLLGGGVIFAGIKSIEKPEEIIAESGWIIQEAQEISNPDFPVVEPAILDNKSLDLGMLVIGGPGAGKSVMAVDVMEYTASRGFGFSYKEGKGDFDIYRMYVQAIGQPDHFFSSELKHSDTINVMSAPTETIIDMFSRVFVDSTNGYYEASQKKAIRATVPLLKSFGVPVALPDLWALLTSAQAARDLIRRAKNESVDPDIIASAEQYFEQDEEDRLNNIDGLLNKMHPFVTGPISRRINAYEPTLDIPTAVASGKRIYFHLPLSDTALAVATMITEIFGVVAKDRQLYEFDDRRPYPLFFDDWGKFFYSNFGPITARCRSAKMPISFFFQSRGQLDAVEMGRVFTTEITDNIAAIWGLRINGWDTAKWMAEQFGTYETTAVSFRGDDTNDQMVSLVEKPRVRADALRDLNAGEAYGMIFETAGGGRMVNRRYKLRFPMPGNGFEAPTNWPEIDSGTPNDEADGLQLWRDYRDPNAVRTRQKEAVKEVLQDLPDSLNSPDSDEIIL